VGHAEQLDYTITGDLSALMQLFGLMSCSSSHPCLYCPLKRSKGKWGINDVQLRSMGSLATQYGGWVTEGSKYDTEHTSRYQSTVGPVIVRSHADKDDTTILEKAAPPAVHLLLSVNDILRPHCIQFFDSESHLMENLKTEVGIIPHNYQGKEGTFEGPLCNKILNKVCIFIIDLYLYIGIHFEFTKFYQCLREKNHIYSYFLAERAGTISS
jgi:hypothetical protein